jgi:hypothetical protein
VSVSATTASFVCEGFCSGDVLLLGTAAPFSLYDLRQLHSGMPSSFATSEIERGCGGNNFLSMASFLSGE